VAPLARVMPVIRKLLVDDAREAGVLVAVGDAQGRMLWVEGDPVLRDRAQDMLLVPGANWSESRVGTNGPGTALALRRPVQIFGAEHLAAQVATWSCSAAPILDPDSGEVLGVLDVSGGDDTAQARTLTLVRAAVAAVESEIRIQRLRARTEGIVHVPSLGHTPATQPKLSVLGTSRARLASGGRPMRLSVRHSEIAVLLAQHPGGLSTGEIAMALSHHDQAQVTVRAEMSRLRSTLEAVVGPSALASRPYRLTCALDTDVAQVHSALARGDVGEAVRLYAGPILPGSDAPAIERMRYDLHVAVRSAVLASRFWHPALEFAQAEHGRDDLEVWEHVVRHCPASSAQFHLAKARVAHLDAELMHH
jgi:transcriptional regulator of acetoin/glycerol metabolism